MKKIIAKKTVFVAMSGGVDSSVAAALMKKADFKVVGVFMKPWSQFASSGSSTDCLWKQDREDALRVAAKLDIPLLTWDLSKDYEKYVAKYMIEGYRKGITPNPDVMCNKFIKFGVFLEKALELGADYIATGHYARKVGSKLLKAKDLNKDQSYFLYTLNRKQLNPCLFPIGDYKKTEIRKMAKKFSLPNWNKKDSQGVCFVGPINMKEFLKNHIKPKSGKILNIDGKIIGEHEGVYYYTIGQRHGLDIKDGGGPYYVVLKNLKKNIIYVGSDKDLMTKQTKVSDIHWVDEGLGLPSKLEVKIRYRTKSEKATLNKNGDLEFSKPQRAITSGQSAVFYRGQEMLGGGIIK